MKKTLALFGAALVLAGTAATASPASAAPKHLNKVSASQSATFNSMDAALRSGFTSFSVNAPRCYGSRDRQYSMLATSNWTRATNGSVKLNSISVSFSRGTSIFDWATSLTVADRTGSINYSSSSYNPGSVSQWFPSNSPSTATGTRNAYARASSSAAGDCYPGAMYP